MALVMEARLGFSEPVQKFLSRCEFKISNEFRIILRIPKDQSFESLRDYLKQANFSLKNRLKIQSRYFRKKQILNHKKEVLSLLEKLKVKDELKSPEKRHKILKRIKSLPFLWWRELFSLLVATEAKNQAWALELKRNLAKSSPYVFLVKNLPFTEEEQAKVRDFILYSLNRYKDQFDDEEGGKILAEKITTMVNTLDFKVIRNRLDADWSLKELRENFKNPLLRSEYFDFWYMVMMNRTSDAEVRSRFRKAFSLRALKNSLSSQLWVLEYFFPPEEVKRNIIVDRLSRMWRQQNLLEQYTVLRVSKDIKVKNLLAEDIPDFKRAEFQLKREYYTKLLNSGQATAFALYELFFLGDKNNENLWWLIL